MCFLKQTVKWRKQNKIDQIFTEDFTEISQKLPLFSGSVDKKGQPGKEKRSLKFIM